MRNTEELLRYILGDAYSFQVQGNLVLIGDKNKRISIVFSCSPNPLESMDLFKDLVTKRKPIIWIKDNFTDQLFRNHDLKEYLPNFKHTITILTPSPKGEIENIDTYELPRELFKIKLFDKTTILKVLQAEEDSITKNDKKVSEISINNLLDSVLYQETFSFPNFLLS